MSRLRLSTGALGYLHKRTIVTNLQHYFSNYIDACAFVGIVAMMRQPLGTSTDVGPRW